MKIIHVDDHTLFAESLNSVLTARTGFEVISMERAREALRLLDTLEDVDLLIVDLGMPEIDGLAMIEAIECRGLLIPVVVISACEDLWEIRRVMNAGAAGFIPKTAKIDEIIAILERIMQGDIYLPKDIKFSLSRLPKQQPENSIESLMARYRISKRQLEVLKLMRQGYDNEDIAQILYLSINTIKTHNSHLFQTFKVNNRIKCLRAAEVAGLLDSGAD